MLFLADVDSNKFPNFLLQLITIQCKTVCTVNEGMSETLNRDSRANLTLEVVEWISNMLRTSQRNLIIYCLLQFILL